MTASAGPVIPASLSGHSAPTATATESVAITRRTASSDGSLVEVATGVDPRPGLGDYVRAVRMERPSAITTNVTLLREVLPANPATLADVTDINHTIRLNGTRETTVDLHLDPTDPACRQEWTVTSPLTSVTTVCEDELGRTRSVSAPGFEPVAITYDGATGGISTITQGVRVTEASYAAPAGGGTQPWPRSIQSMGPGSNVLDELTFTRDAAGWITRLNLQDKWSNSQIDIDWDLRGRLAYLKLPHNETHGFDYTAGSALSRYIPPATASGGVLDIPFFDEMERPEELRVLDGSTVVESMGYTYHGTFGSLSRIDLPGGRAIKIARDTTTTPDSVAVDGRIRGLVLDDAETAYVYDGPFLESETWDGIVAGSVSRDIDAYGELTELTVNATPIAYAHDDDGRLIQAGALVVTPDLYGAGATQHWERDTTLVVGAHSFSSNEVLNRHGELDAFTVDHSSAGTLYSYGVTTRDDLGREVTRTESLSGEATRSYTFDFYGQGRLARARLSGSIVAQYTYDANGNRLSATYSNAWNSRPDISTTDYDAQDRLLKYGACNYTYSAAGQLETRDCGSGTEAFEYDMLGNLLSVDVPTHGVVVDYDVDALGRRIRRRVLDGTTVLEEQRWLYLDGLNPVAELDDSNALTRIFVYGTRANVPDYMIDVATGDGYRFIADPRGSLRAVVDPSGNIVQRTEYDPFGVILDEHLDTGFARVPFGFAGGIHEPLTGLVRFGARDYEPATGRWTAKDPLLFGGGQTNLYVYVDGDPVNRLDPSGAFWIGLAFSAGSSGVSNALYNRNSISPGAAFASGLLGGIAGAGVGAAATFMLAPILGPLAPFVGSAIGGAVSGMLTELLNQYAMQHSSCVPPGSGYGPQSGYDWGRVRNAAIFGGIAGGVAGPIGAGAGARQTMLAPSLADALSESSTRGLASGIAGNYAGFAGNFGSNMIQGIIDVAAAAR